MNVVNMLVMMLGDEFLVLWEGGFVWLFDLDMFVSNGVCCWGQGLDGVFFLVYFKCELGIGIVWNFGQDVMNDCIIFWKIFFEGELFQVGLVLGILGGMIYDFVIIECLFVFLVGSFCFDQMCLFFIDSFSFFLDVLMIVIVIDKDDWM